MERKHYGAIDGLRTIACIGIMMMHVRANSGYEVFGFVYNTVIPSFTNFTFLFMTISAFGMCCGYYEKMLMVSWNYLGFMAKGFRKSFHFSVCLYCWMWCFHRHVRHSMRLLRT